VQRWMTYSCHPSTMKLSTVNGNEVYQKNHRSASSLVLLAWLLDRHLILVAVRRLLVHVGSGEPCHAIGFSLAHPVPLEASVGSFCGEGDEFGDLLFVGMVVVDDLLDRVLRGTRLAVEFPSRNPALCKTRVALGETGHFLLLFHVCQIGHQFHEYLDRLELGGLMGGGWEGFIDRFVGDRVEEFGVGTLEGTRGNAVVVNDGIHFGSMNRMEGFGGDA